MVCGSMLIFTKHRFSAHGKFPFNNYPIGVYGGRISSHKHKHKHTLTISCSGFHRVSGVFLSELPHRISCFLDTMSGLTVLEEELPAMHTGEIFHGSCDRI